MTNTEDTNISKNLLASISSFLKNNIAEKDIDSIPLDIKNFIRDIEHFNNDEKIFSPKKTFKSKGVTVSKNLLISVLDFLKNNIAEKDIDSIPLDIKNFIRDIEHFNNDEKIFSPERVLKLRGVFIAFFSINDITPSKEMKELLDSFKMINSFGEAALYFSNIFDEIYLLLERYPFREFSGVKLYFIDDDARNKLLSFEEKLNSLIRTQVEKKKLRFSKIINFLNPENVSSKYSVSYKSKYQYISKQESLERYLPTHFKITVNKIEKEYRELFATHEFSEKKKQQLLRKKQQEIQKANDEYAYLIEKLKNQNNDIDIKILSYEHSSLYPELKFSESFEVKNTIKYKTKYAHLRSEVINVLWYNPIQLKSSNTVSDILQNYNHAFGDVYYIEEM